MCMELTYSVFRISGMGYLSFYLHICNSAVEIVIIEFTQFSAIHRIGKIAVKFFQIEIQSALPDLFITGKADIYLAMADFRMSHQRLCHLHDHSYAAFVIRT